MAEDFNTKLGFETSGAISGLDALNSKLGEGINRLNEYAAALKSVNSGANLDGLKSISSNLNAATAASDGLVASFGGFAQMITSRLISQGISQIISGLREGTVAAMELSTATAKMGQFAGGRRSESMAKEIIDYSSQMNMGVKEVTAGYQEMLKSGFSNSADQIKVFDASANLAKAQLSELAPAIDLVAGSLKAFGQSADQADMMSSKLAAIANQSKAGIEGLQGSFARSELLGAKMGVSLDELGAALVVLTQSGLKASDANMTLFQTLKSLASPTKSMSDALKSLGYSTAEEGIAARSFGGLLADLAGKTDGTAESFLKLARSGRGVPGVMALGESSVEAYTAALERLQKVDRNYSRDQSDKVMESNGQLIGRKIQQLANTFINDNPFVNLAADLIRDNEHTHALHSSMSALLETATVLTTVALGKSALGWIGSAFVGLSEDLVLVTGGAKAASSALAYMSGAEMLTGIQQLGISLKAIAMAPIGMTGVLAVVAAVGIAAFTAAEMINRNANAEVEARERANTKILHDTQARIAEEQRKEEAATSAKIKLMLSSSSDADKQYQKDISAAQENMSIVERQVKEHLGRLVSAREKYVQDVIAAESKAERAILDSQGRIEDAKNRKEKLLFEGAHANDTETAKAQALLSRAEMMGQRAERDLAAAARTGDERGIKRAEREFGEADRLATEAGSAAKSAKSAELESSARAEAVRLCDMQIRAEENLERAMKKHTASLEQEATEQEGITDKLRTQVKIYEDASKITDKQGKLLPKDQLDDLAAKRAKAMAEIENLSLNSGDQGSAKRLGLTEQFDKALRAQNQNLKPFEQTGAYGPEGWRVQENKVPIGVDLEKSLQEARAKFESAEETWTKHVNYSTTALSKAAGMAVTNPTEGAQAADIVGKRINQLDKKSGEVKELIAVASNLRNEIRASIDQSEREGPNKHVTSDFGDAKTKVLEDFAAIANAEQVADKDLKTLLTDMTTLKDASGADRSLIGMFFRPDEAGYRADLFNLSLAMEKAAQLRNVTRAIPNQKSVEDMSGLEADRAQKRVLEDALSTKTPIDQATSATSAAKQETNSWGDSLLNVLQTLKQISNEYGAAREAVLGTGQSADATAKASGGMTYLDSGGWAKRGRDTVPAMLSPGEMVMNHKASQRFSPQLQAMNAGHQPSYHSHGGSTTNVGDINVHINSAGTVSAGTGRVIASEIHRELRRGASSSFK